ncbi:WD40 repeat-like protein [Piedraia hortae CBS 480.64]|uniref:WD40 repeat-like protein n=1 Tax=Piedraia hortae CBS 480.64 TaxID=1314780 RepID=A0A6A7C8V4_9PEZI|nr:WD40 repeat-like protein [Piedraia hortae CBS 480.64]
MQASVPVTALCFWRHTLLAAQGNRLAAYDRSGRRLCRVCVFDDDAVHGVVVHTDVALVWGGSKVRIVGVRANVQLTPGTLFRAPDWVLDAAFAVHSRFAFVTAHNELHIAAGSAILGAVSGPKCILYSAHLKWTSSSSCLVAAGTAFGDIILWSATVSWEQNTVQSQLHYVFAAHEGSVFGVCISDITDIGRALATCSDDRSIRVWDISDLPNVAHQSQRHTGFGSQNEGNSPTCVAKAMGHASRIWHVRFAGRSTLMSFGEDATCISWNIDPPSLVQGHIGAAHAGKHIWSVATSLDGTVATGGADGAIVRWLPLPRPAVTAIPSRHLGNIAENYKAYAFVDESTIVATTSQGRVVIVELAQPGMSIKEVASRVEGLGNYSIVAGIQGAAFLTGSDGKVHMYTHWNEEIREIHQMNHKATALFPCQDPVPGLLATNFCNPFASLLQFSQGTESHSVQLATPTGFAVTSFEQNKSTAFLGSRNGSLAIYDLSSTSKDNVKHVLITAIHEEAITALRCASPQFVHSTSRDGTHAVHRLHRGNEAWSLTIVHQLALPFGPRIEGIKVDRGNLLLWGFRGKEFIVYDSLVQSQVMTVECGGAHRTWAYRIHQGGGSFVWTKASQLHCKTQTQVPHRLIGSGGHGREIKTVAVSPVDSRMFATGAEDTDIKIHMLTPNFQCCQTIRKHTTGVQHLQWSSDGSRLFSSAGVEEFFVWRITKDLPPSGIGVVCESVHPQSGKSDLRIMGFELNLPHVIMAYSDSTLKRWNFQHGTWTLDAVGDYLTACLTAVCLSPCLLTAATDGHVTRWDKELTWKTRHRVHQNTILCLITCPLTDGSYIVVTGGDDNAIGITCISTQFSTLLLVRAHAAAVTALAIIHQDHDAFIVASASVDQRVKLWEIRVETQESGADSIKVAKRGNRFTAVSDVSSLERCHDGLLVSGVGMEILDVMSGCNAW